MKNVIRLGKIHEHELITIPRWMSNDFCGQKQYCVEYHEAESGVLYIHIQWFWQKHCKQANLYSEKVSESSLLESTCHWVADWFLIPPPNGGLSRAHCWSLILTYWALSSGCSQISLGEWKSVLLSPCITSIPATIATLFKSQLVKERWLGSLISRMSHLVYQIIKLLLCWDRSSLSKDTNIFILRAHSGKSIHIPLPQNSLLPIFQVFDHPVEPLATVHESV